MVANLVRFVKGGGAGQGKGTESARSGLTVRRVTMRVLTLVLAAFAVVEVSAWTPARPFQPPRPCQPRLRAGHQPQSVRHAFARRMMMIAEADAMDWELELLKSNAAFLEEIRRTELIALTELDHFLRLHPPSAPAAQVPEDILG